MCFWGMAHPEVEIQLFVCQLHEWREGAEKKKHSAADTFSLLICRTYFHGVHFVKCRTRRMEEFQIGQMMRLMYSIPFLGLQVLA